jgi:formate transporter
MQASTFDALSPKQIAEKVQKAGVTKADLSILPMFFLAILAGLFIGLGAEFCTLVITGVNIGYGLSKLLGGFVFSLGLILVVVAGAELFTGNNLLTLAWMSRAVSFRRVLRNWGVVFLGNLVGSVGLALLVYASRQWTAPDFGIGATAIKIAVAKVNLPFGAALARGALCNFLVCLAVWLCFSARTVADKILAIIFPITAFVASGFEHSVANMYFIPYGLLLKGQSDVVAAASLSVEQLGNLSVMGFIVNLIPVTIGNLIGGGIMVGMMYWFIYMRGEEKKETVLAERLWVPAFKMLAPPEGIGMIGSDSENHGLPLCSYVIASGDMFYSEVNQRVIYVRNDPVSGFRLWGEVPDLGAASHADLGQVLLEYSLTCEASGDLPQAYRQMDTFAKRLGETLAITIIETLPAKSSTHRAYSALECVLDSMDVSFTVQEVEGQLDYALEDCPLCSTAERTGIRQVRLAHHGLNALCQSMIDAIDSSLDVKVPVGPRSDHVFSMRALSRLQPVRV